MRVIARRDDHRVHVGVFDQRESVPVYARTEFGCHRLRDGCVEVAHRNEFRTGDHRRDLAGMVGAHHPDPDDSHAHCHETEYYILMS